MVFSRLATSLTAVLALAGSVSAQEDESHDELVFSSDRPGFLNVTWAAPKAHLISEAGVQLSTGRGSTQLGVPAVLLRVGVIDGVEARVDVPRVSIAWPGGDDPTAGLTDLGFGFAVAGPLGDRVAVSLVPMIRVPTGSSGTSAGTVLMSVAANLSVTVSPHLLLGAKVAIATVPVPDPVTLEVARELEGSFGGSVGAYFTEELGVYLQGYALRAEGGPWRPFVGVGGTAMVREDMQLDVSVDFGFSDASPVAQIGAGWSTLW